MASTSSSLNSWEYDVFLSFRGADTRNNFTSHLYHALCKEGINAFIDNELRRGKDISSTLFQVIESSSISIVIFSQDYASSTFCLDELVKILKCKTDRGQIVFPVFYNVDPLEVEKHTGSYGIALSGHEAEFKETVPQWKSALAEAANLAGYDLRNRDEAEVIRRIVQDVLQELNRGQSEVTDSYMQRTFSASRESRLRRLKEKENLQTLMLKAISLGGSYV